MMVCAESLIVAVFPFQFKETLSGFYWWGHEVGLREEDDSDWQEQKYVLGNNAYYG